MRRRRRSPWRSNGGFGSWAAGIEIDRTDAADRHAPDRMTQVLALSPGADAAAIATRVKHACGIAHFINHPHFAFSYQIFYEGFGRKAFGPDNDAALRTRYIFAGIVSPVALAAFLAYGLISGDVRTLGLGANLMTLLVGWHYVKQGYGMLMVDAALKRQYFGESEKKVLLMNAYAVWALSWLATNAYLGERSIWDIHFYMFDVPETVVALAFCVAVATSAATVMMLIKKWRANDASLPINGVVA